jgi:hypothetical protein
MYSSLQQSPLLGIHDVACPMRVYMAGHALPLRATSRQLVNITRYVQVVMDLAPAVVSNMCCTALADCCIGAQQSIVLFAFACYGILHRRYPLHAQLNTASGRVPEFLLVMCQLAPKPPW